MQPNKNKYFLKKEKSSNFFGINEIISAQTLTRYIKRRMAIITDVSVYFFIFLKFLTSNKYYFYNKEKKVWVFFLFLFLIIEKTQRIFAQKNARNGAMVENVIPAKVSEGRIC